MARIAVLAFVLVPGLQAWSESLAVLSNLELISEVIVNDTCRRDALTALYEFKNFTQWAVQMWDASAKLPSGLLEGNLRQLGDFDECLSVRGGGVRGRYCLATVHTTPEDSSWERLLNTATAGRRMLEVPGDRKGLAVLPSFAKFEWALCVPASCNAPDVQRALSAAFQLATSGSRLALEPVVHADQCYTTTNATFTPADWVMVCFLTTTLLLVIAGSVFEYTMDRWKRVETGAWSKVLLAFSAPANWRRLSIPCSTVGAVDCLDGIRALSTLWVVMTHKIMHLSQQPWVNKVIMIEAMQDLPKMPLLNSMLNVDTFFVLSGLLRASTVMAALEQGRFRVLHSALQRYVRLSPAYFVMVGFYATLLMYVGSGPAWNQTMGVNSEYCRDNWLLNVLYVNNYFDYGSMCMLQSWYLSADMQLFLLSPLVIYPLWKWPRIGKTLLMALLGISIVVPMATILFYRYPGVYHLGMNDDQLRMYMQHIYMATHNRMSPYLVGLALGCLLYSTREKQVQLRKSLVAVGWALCLATLMAVVFGPYQMMQLRHPYSVLEASVFGGMHRFVWAAAVGWLVFACHNGYGGAINSILAAPIFRPLSRLSYCVYLTHFAVFLFDSSRIRTAIWMDEFMLTHHFIGDAAIMLGISVLLYMAYEGPSLVIAKLLVQKGLPPTTSDSRSLNREKISENR